MYFGGEERILKSTIDEFKNKYPGIKIEKVVFNDAQKYNQKLLSDTLSGGGPDILFFNTNYVNEKTLFSDDEAVLSYLLGLLQSQSKIKALTGEDVVMGTMPTYNRGQNEIIAKVEDCMAINKKTRNKKAAYNFIKIALSEKAQKNINSIPVNRTMAKNIKSNYLKQFNGKDSIVISNPSGSEKVTLIKPSNDIEKYYDDVTGNISEVKIIDPTIEKLIMESFEPYFENKKSYDEALKVLQDKVKLYIDE